MTVSAPMGRACGGRPRRTLRRPDHGGGHPQPETFELCLLLLAEAMARAERWCALRERALIDFDRRAVEMVRSLHNAGMLASSTNWVVG